MFSQATQLITCSFLLVMGSFFTGVTSMLVLDEKWKWKMHVNSFLLKLVITKGYGVRATTIEGQNVPAFCFAYVSRDKWSKRA